jgi:phosphatidylinositol glycan class N
MPANSEGKLPLDYLAVSQEAKARASLANARGVLEMYRVKHGAWAVWPVVS